MSALRSLLLGAGLLAGALLVLVGVLIFFGQRRLIFPGSSVPGGEGPESRGGERIWLG